MFRAVPLERTRNLLLMETRRSAIFEAVCAACFAAALLVSPAHGETYQILARTGETAPVNFGASAEWNRFTVDVASLPIIGPNGEVVSRTEVSSSDGTALGLASFPPGAPAQFVIKEGDGVPNLSGTIVGTAVPIQVDQSGRVYFDAQLPIQPSGALFSSWCFQSASSTPLVRLRMSVPGVSPTATLSSVLTGPYPATANGGCETSFSGAVAGGSSTFAGAFRATTSGLETLAATGQPAPGTNGGTFSSTLQLVSNARGDGILVGRFVPPGLTVSSEGIWKVQAGVLSLIAKTGDPVPGVTSGVLFNSFVINGYLPAINASGIASFVATVKAPGGTGLGSYALFTVSGSGVSTVFVQGDRAYEAGASYRFGRIILDGSEQKLFVGDDGSVATAFTLDGPAQTTFNFTRYDALLLVRGARRTVLLRGAHRAPDLPSSAIIPAGIPRGGLFKVNAVGQAALAVNLTSDGFTPTSTWALYASLPGSMQLQAKSGMAIPNSGGATLSAFGLSGTRNNIEINNLGQILAPVTIIQSGGGQRGDIPLRVDGYGQVRLLAPEPLTVSYLGQNLSLFGVSVQYGKALNSQGQVAAAALVQSGAFPDDVLMRINIPNTNPGCIADRNSDGRGTVTDAALFLQSWWSGNADFNFDGATNNQDIFDYSTAFLRC